MAFSGAPNFVLRANLGSYNPYALIRIGAFQTG